MRLHTNNDICCKYHLRRMVAPIAVATLLLIGALGALAKGQTSDAGALRILTVGSDVTEIVHALGFGEKIIAVDSTSRHPPQLLETRKSVGYMRALSAEGVLSVGANLLLVSEGAGPPEAIKALKASSAQYVSIPNGKSADGLIAKIKVLGRELDADDKADELVTRVRKRLSELEQRRQTVGRRARVLFVLNAAEGRLIVGGANSSADEALTLAGAENAASSITGFKPITNEGLLAMAPDAILVMEGGRGGMNASQLAEVPAVKATPAGRTGKLRDISGVYLLGFGPRLPDAANDLYEWIYRDAR